MTSTTTSLKPITVWGQGGPNPPKVVMVLMELNLPHTIIPYPISDVKKPEYLAINPNGRLPSIHDPNTDLTLWESGAIVEYLIETYDKDHKLSFEAGTPEYWHAKQWLYFQATGQGPYYGQAAWFKLFHKEKIPSAVDRYVGEINRVTGVLDKWLEKQETGEDGGKWLVGNKFSYADLVFVAYQNVVKVVTTREEYDEDNFPAVKEWMRRMGERESVRLNGPGKAH